MDTEREPTKLELKAVEKANELLSVEASPENFVKALHSAGYEIVKMKDK
jgi:hypothetical protein